MATEREMAIAIRPCSGSPEPAGVCFVHFRPKAFFQGLMDRWQGMTYFAACAMAVTPTFVPVKLSMGFVVKAARTAFERGDSLHVRTSLYGQRCGLGSVVDKDHARLASGDQPLPNHKSVTHILLKLKEKHSDDCRI